MGDIVGRVNVDMLIENRLDNDTEEAACFAEWLDRVDVVDRVGVGTVYRGETIAKNESDFDPEFDG